MAKAMTFPLECYSQGIETLIHFSNPHNGIDILNLRTLTPSMVGLMRPCVVGGENHIILGWIRDFLSPKVQVSSTGHVQDLKAPRPRYKDHWIPLQIHAWFFEELSMAIDYSMVYLGTKAFFTKESLSRS